MKKVLTFGVYDFFHLGHLRLFKQCKKYGDYLIVAVQNSESVLKYKPEAKLLYSNEERIEILENIKIVDKVVIYNDVGVRDIEKIDFDILAFGEDHIGERFEIVEEWCKKNGKEIVRLKRTKGICSSEIKNNL